MAPAAAPARAGLSVRGLPPNIFAVVMATGIVSLALNGAGYQLLAHTLFWLNVGVYAVLVSFSSSGPWATGPISWADMGSHAKAPGFFTLVVAPCEGVNTCEATRFSR